MAKPDLSDFDDARTRRTAGPMLRVDHVLAQLPADRADQLRAALADPAYSRRVISDVVSQRWGVPLSSTAVDNWRRRHGLA